MKIRAILFIWIIFTLLISASILAAEDVVVYALEAMPLSGVVDGNPSGIAVDILNEATKNGAPRFIFVFNTPWARAQIQVQQPSKEVAAIIPFSRSTPREKKYKWIAELCKSQFRFYSFGRATPIKSLDDAKDISIGVVHGHVLIPILKELGITNIDEGSATAEVNAKKMLNKRYDTIADLDWICLYNWKKIGQKTQDLQVGPPIGNVDHIYIASGLDFPDETAKIISDVIEKMHKTGKLQKILDKWK